MDNQNNTTEDILFEELSGRGGNLGLITLNRQQALNALNHKMSLAFTAQLTEWETADHIKAVIIRAAEGRAFCAGGDIRETYEKKMRNDPELLTIFHDEYRLDSQIFDYKKPYIALLDGITMGGGAGISLQGSHRVGTERLVFAMPETAIGFFPDVGASYFLSRLPYKIGFYLGLTGSRIFYNDCFWLRLADYCVPRDSLSELIFAIADSLLPEDPKNEIAAIIDSFAIECPESNVLFHKSKIESCFSKNTVEEIFYALEQDGSEWCQQTVENMKTKSPTSLKVTLKALQKGTVLGFHDCMRMEYQLAYHFLQGHDFFEGIRATIIDKGQKPRWKPATLEILSEEEVERYFVTQNDFLGLY